MKYLFVHFENVTKILSFSINDVFITRISFRIFVTGICFYARPKCLQKLANIFGFMSAENTKMFLFDMVACVPEKCQAFFSVYTSTCSL